MLCSKCGKEVPQGNAFCANCGAQVTPPAPGAAPPPPAQPGQYEAPQAPPPAAAPPPSYTAAPQQPAPQQPAPQSQYQAPTAAAPPSPPQAPAQPGQYGAAPPPPSAAAPPPSYTAPPSAAPPSSYTQPPQPGQPGQQAPYSYGPAPGAPGTPGGAGYPPAGAAPPQKSGGKGKFIIIGVLVLAAVALVIVAMVVLFGGNNDVPVSRSGSSSVSVAEKVTPLAVEFRGESIELGMSEADVVELLGEFDDEDEGSLSDLADDSDLPNIPIKDASYWNDEDYTELNLLFTGSGADSKLVAIGTDDPSAKAYAGFAVDDTVEELKEKLGAEHSFVDSNGDEEELYLFFDEKGQIVDGIDPTDDKYTGYDDLADEGVQYMMMLDCYTGSAEEIMIMDIEFAKLIAR